MAETSDKTSLPPITAAGWLLIASVGGFALNGASMWWAVISPKDEMARIQNDISLLKREYTQRTEVMVEIKRLDDRIREILERSVENAEYREAIKRLDQRLDILAAEARRLETSASQLNDLWNKWVRDIEERKRGRG